jgi:transcriptional regulator with XRE-family HTH domain
MFDYRKGLTRVDGQNQPAILDMNTMKPTEAKHLGTLAGRLRFARRQKGLTQEELARVVNSTQQVIQSIESGKTKQPRILNELAQAVDVSPAWLQFGIEEIDSLDKEAVMLALSWMNLDEPHKSAMKNAILEMAKKPKK